MSWLSDAWHWYAAERLLQSGGVDHPHAALVNPIGAGVVSVATAVGACLSLEDQPVVATQGRMARSPNSIRGWT